MASMKRAVRQLQKQIRWVQVLGFGGFKLIYFVDEPWLEQPEYELDPVFAGTIERYKKHMKENGDKRGIVALPNWEETHKYLTRLLPYSKKMDEVEQFAKENGLTEERLGVVLEKMEAAGRDVSLIHEVIRNIKLRREQKEKENTCGPSTTAPPAAN